MKAHSIQPPPALHAGPAADIGRWDADGATYRVTVRNEITGELAVIDWEATCKEDAQLDVLHMMFRSRGWRKARAMVPEAVEAAPEAA